MLLDRLKAEKWFSAGDVDAVQHHELYVDDVVSTLNDLKTRYGEQYARSVAKQFKSMLDKSREKQLPLLNKAVLVEAGECAAYMFADDSPPIVRKWDWGKDFPNVMPPFPITFVEWMTPQWCDTGLPKFIGVMFVLSKRGEPSPVPELTAQEVDYTHHVTAFCYYSSRVQGSPVETGSCIHYLVDRHGAKVGDAFLSGRNLTTTKLPDDPLGEDDEHRVERFRAAGHDVRSAATFMILSAPALLALTFMHCKTGVTVSDVVPDCKLQRARERRGKPPITVYKTIKISGLSATLRNRNREPSEKLMRSLSLIRGHFATYTSEAPLFGRHVGTFYRPAHMRGSKEVGEVIKDYEVGP